MSGKKIDLKPYIRIIEPKFQKEYGRPRKPYVHKETILGDNSPEARQALITSHEVRQNQMKEGNLIQIAYGNFYGWEDLGVGHPSKLDIRKLDNSIIIELKNRSNTCNSDTSKSVFDKLADYKIDNPNTKCVFGIVNPKNPKSKKLYTVIKHNGVEILKVQGKELIKMIFNLDGVDYSDEAIQKIQELNEKYRKYFKKEIY